MSGVLDSRVHNMGLRYNGTHPDLPRDIKEVLMSDMYRQDKEDSNRPDWIGGKPLDSRVGISDIYIVFDTIERDLNTSDLSKGLISFNIRNEGVTGNGYIGAKNDLHDITGIESNSFIFPYLPCRLYTINEETSTHKQGLDSTIPILKANVCTGSGYPCNDPLKLPTTTNWAGVPPCTIDTNSCDVCPSYLSQLEAPRISLEIKEVAEQSISDTGGKKHSLEYDIVAPGTVPAGCSSNHYASPINYGYMFTDPISRLDTITFVFRNHTGQPIVFNPDIFKNVIIDSTKFVYTTDIPGVAQPPYIYPYPDDNILPGTLGLPIPVGYALPAIPVYYNQFLEFLVETWNAYGTEGVLRPNTQLTLRHLDSKITPPKLYSYLTHSLLLSGANGYDPATSFRLNPDIVGTEFISAYSKSYNILSRGVNYTTVTRTTKNITLHYSKQIVIREWKEVTQPWLLEPRPLPVGNFTFHKFVEGRHFYIDNVIVDDNRIGLIWEGRTFFVKDPTTDIYYDRVVLTEADGSLLLSTITIPNANGEGIYKNIRSMKVATPLPREKHRRITLGPHQYIVEPNIRTDFYDLVEGQQFMFDGQGINTTYTPPSIPGYISTSLSAKKFIFNTTGPAVRLFHQGVIEDSLGGGNFSDLTPTPTNRVYHIQAMSDIYADKIILTAGYPGLSGVEVIIPSNRLRIPMRFRKLVRRITNLVAP